MSRFITPDLPVRHQGLIRLNHIVDTLSYAVTRLRGARGFATLVLAGVVAGLIVVADQVVSTWAEGELFAAWVALWAVMFAAVALFSDVVRGWGNTLSAAYEAWATRRSDAARDADMLEAARFDPRLMAELEAALQRAGLPGQISRR